MYKISDEQLNEYLFYISNKVNFQYPEYFDIINFFILSGIRISDIFNFNNYTIVDEKTVTLLQSKNKTIRTFDISIIPNCTKLFLEGDTEIIKYFNINHLTNYLDNIFKSYKLIADNRIVNSYSFRYNRFKQYYKEYQDIKTVSNKMGEVNDVNTVGYIFKNIYTTSEFLISNTA